MKIFIVGPTNSGKSTLANYISNIYKCPIISAGAYMKENFYQEASETKENYTERITKTAMSTLKSNPNFFLEKMIDKIINHQINNGDKNIIIEGIRNPRDFSFLFNQNEDVIIRVSTASNTKNEYPLFETMGLKIIDEIIGYFNLINPVNIFFYSISAPTVEQSISKHLYEYLHQAN